MARLDACGAVWRDPLPQNHPAPLSALAGTVHVLVVPPGETFRGKSMKAVDLSKLPDYLQGQRWFASKGLPIKDIALVEQVPIDVPGSTAGAEPFVVAIIEVTYELGPPERYQLHVCA